MGILSWLFGRKQQEQPAQQSYQEEQRAWPETFEADDVLNCCEQIGAFEDLGITNEALINQICQSVADSFNAKEKTFKNLEASFLEGFSANGMQATQNKAKLFASCYIDSYINNM